ncbi:MAG: hypothetical protein H6817_11060 [Phycisphaerales bacterium]|nr:hypothetical protein [Phycisphaerales bacterium]
MHPVEIREHLRRQPFEPFRVHISDGTHYDVRHPEMAYVTARELYIAVKMAEDDLPEKMVWCDPLHVTRIEHIATNGSRGKRKRS